MRRSLSTCVRVCALSIVAGMGLGACIDAGQKPASDSGVADSQGDTVGDVIEVGGDSVDSGGELVDTGGDGSETTLPPGCCLTVDDCLAGAAAAPLAQACVGGVCVRALLAGECYAETDCGPDKTCQGESVCPCQAQCDQPTTPGACVPLADNCCHGDADCADNGAASKCAAITDDNPGVCTAPPEAGVCYDDGDCPGGYCDQISNCGCGLRCALIPGACHPLPLGCCGDAGDCEAGEVCVDSDILPVGRCEAPVSGGCWNDAGCGLGEVCVGASVCPCGAACLVADHPGQCEPASAAGCCVSDADCDAGQTCAEDHGPGNEGVCEPSAGLGQCWVDRECPLGATCEGAYACGCSDICMGPMADMPGTCKATSPGCCLADGDCDQTGGPARCVGVFGPGASSAGQCMPAPAQGACYADRDCAGGVCQGAMVCGCMQDCAVFPGTCGAVAGGCCKADSQCGDGERCVGASVDSAGVCEPAPAVGSCWTSADCAAGEGCKGAAVCPCGAECVVADHVGTCEVQTPPACCWLDAQCGAGYTCAHELEVSSLGPCMPEVGPGACWDNQDCATGTTCVGASYCPCGVPCDRIEKPGVCKAGADGCCLSDADCKGGEACEPVDLAGGVGVCKVPPVSGCWSAAQCQDGQACLGAQLCPCGVSCLVADTPGVCRDLPSGCCLDDAGCPDGQVCEGSAGDLPGACKPDPKGPSCTTDTGCCWTAADCGPGMLCKDPRLCGCIDLCPTCGACAPDALGRCEPATGACCGADSDCPRDFVCAGGASDFGAVCEPAPDAGTCWSDAQCAPGLRCDGARVCPCGALCLLADAPGKCVP